MINRVTFKIVGRAECSDGRLSLNAQCFVNKERVLIPLSIYVDAKFFDTKSQLIKSACTEAVYWNAMLSDARNRCSAILADSNIKSIRLNRTNFRLLFTQSSDTGIDFIAFCRAELERRSVEISMGTFRQHKSWLKKISTFKNVLPFYDLNTNVITEFDRWLAKNGNNINTRAIALKNFKSYINHAIRHYSPMGIRIENPFLFHKIKQGQGRIVFCPREELQKLLNKYFRMELDNPLRESLLVFLVASFTSLRISDIKLIKPEWVENGTITFLPHKTRRYKRIVSFDLPNIALRVLHDLFVLKMQKPLKSEQKINTDLKLIAAKNQINKVLSTHVGRHTFATNYLTNRGTERGTVEVLQQIMGHSRIETTMRYVHIVDERKSIQIKNFDNEFKTYAN